MSTEQARVTAADVAKKAGVSRATVSYVLNDAPNQTISASTRQAVHEAAQALGYRPHPMAQSLKRGHSTTVLLPLPGLTMSHVIAQAIDGCAVALSRSGLTLVTDFSRHDDPADQVEAWLRLHPAAVIDLALAAGDPVLDGLRAVGVRLLSTSELAVAGQAPADTMALRARETQVDYLLATGRRRLLLAGPGAPDAAVTRRVESALGKAARAAGATLTRSRAPMTRAGVDAVVAAWRKGRTRPDAICAYNDEFAIALLSALAAAGVGVPDDVAVIGVDDIPMAAMVTPTLTTVAGDFRSFGEALAAATSAAIDGSAADVDLALPTVAVVARQSA